MAHYVCTYIDNGEKYVGKFLLWMNTASMGLVVNCRHGPEQETIRTRLEFEPVHCTARKNSLYVVGVSWCDAASAGVCSPRRVHRNLFDLWMW